MVCISFTTLSFVLIALVASTYYGYFCFDIHGIVCNTFEDRVNFSKGDGNRCQFPYSKCPHIEHINLHEKWTQIVFNFLGALLGWLTLFIILPFQEGFHISWSIENLKFLLPLSYVAYIGITGRLPYITTALENPLKKLFSN